MPLRHQLRHEAPSNRSGSAGKKDTHRRFLLMLVRVPE
jgi:hypothetical protein